MELSLAVNHSLLALHRIGIYCTEPFRIPHAGKLTVCCFDKTGTLTSSDLVVEGVVVTEEAATKEGIVSNDVTSSGVATAGPSCTAAATGRQKASGKTSEGKKLTAAKAKAADKAEAAAAALNESGHVDGYVLVNAGSAPLGAAIVIAGCHALVYADGTLLGDPMEKAAIAAAGWTYLADQTCTRVHSIASSILGSSSSASVRPFLRILKRFPFSSDLKRSSTIVDVDLRSYPSLYSGNASIMSAPATLDGCRGRYVLAKGSPETLRTLLAEVPPGYDEAHLHHTLHGKRVIALASKLIGSLGPSATGGSSSSTPPLMSRDDAEQGLTFCGFLVLHCPAKPESQAVLGALSHSGAFVTRKYPLVAMIPWRSATTTPLCRTLRCRFSCWVRQGTRCRCSRVTHCSRQHMRPTVLGSLPALPCCSTSHLMSVEWTASQMVAS